MTASNVDQEHSESIMPAQCFRRSAKDGSLWCEDVPLENVARRFGTPTYVYSRKMVESRFDAYDSAFGQTPHLVCYAVKANATLGILELLARRGAGFDTVSAGEILKAVAAGADPSKIVFSGVGKSRPEIALALFAGIRCFNVESVEELERIEAEAARLGRRAPIAVRVNPDVDPHVEERIATGLGTSKFGVDRADVLPLYRRAKMLPHIDIVGISCHIGSQIRTTAPYLQMVTVLADIVHALRAEGITLQHIDFGGGAGVYPDGDYSALHPPVWLAAYEAEHGIPAPSGGEPVEQDSSSGLIWLDPQLAVEDGKVLLTVGGETTDITGRFSESEAYVRTDEGVDGSTHVILVVGGTAEEPYEAEIILRDDGTWCAVSGAPEDSTWFDA